MESREGHASSEYDASESQVNFRNRAVRYALVYKPANCNNIVLLCSSVFLIYFLSDTSIGSLVRIVIKTGHDKNNETAVR